MGDPKVISRLSRILAAMAAVAAFSAGALADGVVVTSTSSAHDVGDRIAVGAQVQVESGAEVTVLDRSGVTQRIAAPGSRYQEPASTSAPSRRGGAQSVFQRLSLKFASLGRRAELGTIRGGSLGVDCDADAGRSIPRPECVAEPWSFSIQSEIDGFMACDYRDADGGWRRLPLGLDGEPMPIGADRIYDLSSDGGEGWPDASADDEIAVRCQAVDDATWFALEPRWSEDYDADEAHALMQTFAAVRGGAFVEAAPEE